MLHIIQKYYIITPIICFKCIVFVLNVRKLYRNPILLIKQVSVQLVFETWTSTERPQRVSSCLEASWKLFSRIFLSTNVRMYSTVSHCCLMYVKNLRLILTRCNDSKEAAIQVFINTRFKICIMSFAQILHFYKCSVTTFSGSVNLLE